MARDLKQNRLAFMVLPTYAPYFVPSTYHLGQKPPDYQGMITDSL